MSTVQSKTEDDPQVSSTNFKFMVEMYLEIGNICRLKDFILGVKMFSKQKLLTPNKRLPLISHEAEMLEKLLFCDSLI